MAPKCKGSGGRFPFGPEQKGIGGKHGIPIKCMEVTGKTKAYRMLMRARWRRAKKIASALIGHAQIPVTPLPNPLTGPSHHIVRLFDKKKPYYSVDLLFKDTDGYLVGFRRLRYIENEWTGQTWFCYSDAMTSLPEEIKKYAVSLGFDSSHKDGSKTTPGNIEAMHDMFEILSKCEDFTRDRKTKELQNEDDRAKVQKALLRAIVIFSEAFRFRCVYLSMLERIIDGNTETKVDPATWLLIHNWGHASDLLLELWTNGLPPMHAMAPAWFQGIKVPRPRSELKNLDQMRDLIGTEGELMLLNVLSHAIITDKQKAILEKELKKRDALPIEDPGFD